MGTMVLLHPRRQVGEPAADPLLTPGEVARQLGVVVTTVGRLVDAGQLRGVRTAGGHRRIPASAVRAFVARGQRPKAGKGQAAPGLRILFVGPLGALGRQVAARLGAAQGAVAEDPIDALFCLGEERQDVVVVDGAVPGAPRFYERLMRASWLSHLQVVVLGARRAGQARLTFLPKNVSGPVLARWVRERFRQAPVTAG